MCEEEIFKWFVTFPRVFGRLFKFVCFFDLFFLRFVVCVRFLGLSRLCEGRF